MTIILYLFAVKDGSVAKLAHGNSQSVTLGCQTPVLEGCCPETFKCVIAETHLNKMATGIRPGLTLYAVP